MLVRTTITSLILFLATSIATAEMIDSLAFQGFENDASSNWNFTPDPDENDLGSDVWGVASSVGFFPNEIEASSGSNFWAMRDLEGLGESLTLDFDAINTAGFNSLELSFDYNAFRYDSLERLDYEVFVDGVSQGLTNVFTGANNSNGGLSTDGWQTETVSIGTAANVSLRLAAIQSGNGDWAGWDNISLVGKSSAIPEPMTAATFVIGLGMVMRRRRA